MSKSLLDMIQIREFISNEEPLFTEINEMLDDTLRLISKLNTGYKTP